MAHSHKPSPRASTSKRAPIDALPRTSEGPADAWASEALPSDPSPTAHIPQEPEGFPPSPRSIPPVHWANPSEARAWLDAARATFKDLVALAREGSRRIKHRVLSRAELRRQARDAERALLALFDAADAALPGSPAERGEEPQRLAQPQGGGFQT